MQRAGRGTSCALEVLWNRRKCHVKSLSVLRAGARHGERGQPFQPSHPSSLAHQSSERPRRCGRRHHLQGARLHKVPEVRLRQEGVRLSCGVAAKILALRGTRRGPLFFVLCRLVLGGLGNGAKVPSPRKAAPLYPAGIRPGCSGNRPRPTTAKAGPSCPAVAP